MSESYGGFFLSRVDAALQRPVLDAARAYLAHDYLAGLGIKRFFAPRAYLIRRYFARRGTQLYFATRRECPVLLVGVLEPESGGSAWSWYGQHAGLGARLAEATGATVWAYVFENNGGCERVCRFEPDGRADLPEVASLDALAAQMGVRPDSSEDEHIRLKAAMPLGRLANELQIVRRVLERDLSFFTDHCTVPLDGRDEPDALARYLAGPLQPLPESPGPGERCLEIFLPAPMAREVQQAADDLGVPQGTLLWAAWDIAKRELCAETEVALSPPELPAALVIDAAAEAPPLPPGGGVSQVTPALPERVYREVVGLAAAEDLSLSKVLQRSWRLARGPLLGARRR